MSFTGAHAGGCTITSVPVEASFLLSDVSGHSPSTSYTFSSKSIGAADSTRIIIVGIMGGGVGSPTAVSTCTVAGTSATLTKAIVDATHIVEMWQASVSAGTSGDIVVTTSSGWEGCGIGLWRLIGANPTAAATYSDQYSSNPLTASVSVSAGGVLIANAEKNGEAIRVTYTNVTESYDEPVIAGGYDMAHSGAFIAKEETSSFTVTCDQGSASRSAMVVATWNPL